MVANIYGHLTTLRPYMTHNGHGRKTSAEILNELHERRGLSLREVAKLAGFKSHATVQQALSRGITTAQTGTMQGLARAYGVSESAMLEIARGRDPFVGTDEPEPTRPAQHLEVHPDWIRVPVYGPISAGDGSPSPLSGDVAYVPKERLRKKGSAPEQIRVYIVNGTCMVSEETRRIEKNYAPGDYIAVDFTKGYEVGCVVAAWWEEEQKLVIKRYKLEANNIVLYPLSPGQPSIVLPSEDDVHIIGPVVWRGG